VKKVKKEKIIQIGINGNVDFIFEDGTTAQAFWVSFAPELHSDEEFLQAGGEYNEDNVKICDSGLTAAQIVELAYKYNG
jgi:hypothetical protein